MIKRVPLPPYLPDQSINSGVLLEARNVFPALDGYRPVRDIYSVSEALSGTFLGGFSAIANDGSSYLLAGTDADLFRYSSDGSWDMLATALSVSQRWRFVQFGSFIIAVNGGSTREVDLSSSTASEIPSAPSGTSIAVIGDHVVIGRAGGDVAKVQWCAFRDHTAWVDGTDQAGSQPMLTGGVVQYIAGGEYGVILQRERLVRMTRTGNSSAPFEFDEISANFGCADGATVAQAGRTIFFRSDRGFMALDDGQELRAIGSEKVDRTFDEVVSRSDYDNIFTAIDPQNKLVFWGVPGSPGTLWCYNYELDRWVTQEMVFNGVFPGFTTSIGLDDLSATYPDLDTMPYSLDDPRWSGSVPRLYFVNGDNEIGPLAGDILAARMDLGYYELVKGARSRVRSVRPVWDGTDGMTLILNSKARMGDNDNLSTEESLRPSGKIPIRAAGRYVSTSVRIEAATDWSLIQALEFDVGEGGRR